MSDFTPNVAPNVAVNATTQSQQEAYQNMYRLWLSATANQSIIIFREQMRIDFDMYDGIQWTSAEVADLKNRGQVPVVINRIKTPIDNLSGVEIQTRVKAIYKSSNNKPSSIDLAEALTNYSMQIQDQQDVSYQQSLKYRDHLICGIGWSHYYQEGDQTYYEYLDPSTVIWDPDDLTPQFTNSTFVSQYFWMPLEDAQAMFPKHAQSFESMADQWSVSAGVGALSAPLNARQMDVISQFYQWNTNRIMIVRMQYRTEATLYRAVTWDNKIIESFNKEEVLEVCRDKDEIDEESSSRIMEGYFTQSLLLEHKPLSVIMPGTRDFTIIPIVYQRRYEDGVPYGKVFMARDAQRDYNKRRSKMLHYLCANFIVMDTDAVEGMSNEQMKVEFNQPDVIVTKQPGSDFQRITNIELANGQFELMKQAEQEIMAVMGIVPEQLGQTSNATSRVAINERQINSTRNEIPHLDTLMMMKKREAGVLLAYMQRMQNRDVLTRIYRDEEMVDTFILNEQITTPDGKIIIANDIRTESFDISVEEVRDFDTPAQQQSQTLREILAMPNAQLILNSVELLRRLGISDAKKLVQEFSQLTQGQPQATAGGAAPGSAQPSGGQGGQVPQIPSPLGRSGGMSLGG